MSKRIFTEEEIRSISANENVARASQRSITYTEEFRKRAHALHKEGMTPQEIFRQAGFNITAVGRSTPKECLKRWDRIVRKKGVAGLAESRGGRGGRKPKPKDASDKDRIKRLEIEVAYLKAENAFLATLRKQRLN